MLQIIKRLQLINITVCLNTPQNQNKNILTEAIYNEAFWAKFSRFSSPLSYLCYNCSTRFLDLIRPSFTNFGLFFGTHCIWNRKSETTASNFIWGWQITRIFIRKWFKKPFLVNKNVHLLSFLSIKENRSTLCWYQHRNTHPAKWLMNIYIHIIYIHIYYLYIYIYIYIYIICPSTWVAIKPLWS